VVDVTLRPVGVVEGGRTEPVDDGWGPVEAVIRLDASRFTADALAGLDGFSHVDVVFVFHRVPESDVVPGARHPRERADWPLVGIFAQRGRVRPNRLGVSTCSVVRVDVDGLAVHVRGLDAIDGTPVLDIKPHVPAMGPRGAVRVPPWMDELMSGYW
jgi:tRNA-Thr(GGU) m(6)t(6)A37 methyltransferase TsaA